MKQTGDNIEIEWLRTVLFGPILEWLKCNSVADARARALLAKWARDYGERETIGAAVACCKAKAGEPVSFMTKCLQESFPAPSAAEPQESEEKRLETTAWFVRKGIHSIGPGDATQPHRIRAAVAAGKISEREADQWGAWR